MTVHEKRDHLPHFILFHFFTPIESSGLKRDHLPHFILFHFFTPIESSGFGDCSGTFRKRMHCSVVKVHPGTRVPPAKHFAEKDASDC